MTNMFINYDNQPQDYIPNNISHITCCKDKYYDTIVRGTTPRHSFILPFDTTFIQGLANGEISRVILTYKQGITKVLEKTNNELSFLDEEPNNRCIVYVTLTQEETYLFKAITNTPVEVQLKVIVDETSDVLVTQRYLMNVLDALNQDVIVSNKGE